MTPNYFNDLEKRCAKLRRKRLIQIGASAVVILMACAYVLKAYLPTPNSSHTITQNPPQITTVPKVPLNETPKKEESSAQETIRVIPPIEENTTLKTDITPTVSQQEILFLQVKGVHTRESLPQEESQEALRALEEERRLLQRFDENQTFENANTLAEYFQSIKSYKETMEWAKKASIYDPSSPKPRLLYAKALFSSGRKDEAISSLELFLSYIKSSEVEALLNFYKGQQ